MIERIVNGILNPKKCLIKKGRFSSAGLECIFSAEVLVIAFFLLTFETVTSVNSCEAIGPLWLGPL